MAIKRKQGVSMLVAREVQRLVLCCGSDRSSIANSCGIDPKTVDKYLKRVADKGPVEFSAPVYRQCAVSYTDFWKSYSTVFPSKRHQAVGKESGKTNAIERFNCTMRQRVLRLVRKTLSFSKKLENNIGAIWNFVHHYNACYKLINHSDFSTAKKRFDFFQFYKYKYVHILNLVHKKMKIQII